MKVFILIIIALIVGFLLYYEKTPQGKGLLGEGKVLDVLGKDDPTIGKYVFWDYRFKNQDKTVQIDFLEICTKGILVIECKSYSGMIFGEESQHNWTQTLSYGKVKNQFYNPVKQNASHCYNLKSVIGSKYPIISIIVFASGDISNVKVKNVVELANLKNYIDELPDKLTVEESKEAFKIVYDNSQKISKSEHIENINENLDKIDNNICPRCGGKLVERNGKYGKFYGCSNYPKCKFKKK